MSGLPTRREIREETRRESRREAHPEPRRDARRGKSSGTPRWARGRLGVLALLSVLLLAAGVLLATVARPLERTTAELPSGALSAPLVVLSPQLLGARGGDVEVTARGDGPVLVASGSAGDVQAWSRGTTTSSATVLDDDGGVRVERADGSAPAPDPAGSDLWTAQQRGDGSAQLSLGATAVTATSGPSAQAVLVASDGTAPAPSRVQVTWSSRPVPLVAVLLLAAGAVCGAGAVLSALTSAGLLSPRRRVAAEVPA